MTGTSTAAMPSDIKDENRKAVLSAFHDKKLLTAADISAKTGISRQTVKKCIDYFTANRMLDFCGKGDSSSVGGKRPELYSMNNAMRLICITMHHHDLLITAMDLHYNRLESWRSDKNSFENLDMLFDTIKNGVGEIAKKIALHSVVGVCFATPLGADSDSRLVFATPYPNWPESDFGRSLSEPLCRIFPQAANVVVVGDGRAAGYAMLKSDYGKYSAGDMITYYTANGIGGALFNGGKAYSEKKKLVETIGHIVVAPDDDELCGCGGHGCLERMVGRGRMKRRLAERPQEYAQSVLKDVKIEEMTFKKLFEGSREGDELCRGEVRYFAEMFAAAIRSILLTVQPDYIVIQGDFGWADDVFKTTLTDRIDEFKYLSILSQRYEIVYDKKELVDEEITGCAYMLITDVIENSEKYIG